MSIPSRKPPGTPAGGEFAVKVRAEPDVDLGSSRIDLSAVPPSQVDSVRSDLNRRYRVGYDAPSRTLREIVESTPAPTKVRVKPSSGKTAYAVAADDSAGRSVLIPVRKSTWDVLNLPAPN